MTQTDASPPYVRPDVAAFLDFLKTAAAPDVTQVPVVESRIAGKARRALTDLPTGPLAVLRDIAAPGPAGPIPLRVMDARDRREPGPVMVYFHGGGWVFGDLDSHEPPCAEMARVLDMPVISVDYRLAPEHVWPAAPEDCEAAARWIASGPAELGFAPTGLVLAGDSAGGTLTISTALALRDEPAAVPAIAQWAIYPAADMAGDHASYRTFGEDHFLTSKVMDWFQDQYAPDLTHWRASPMLRDLAGLPPALVTTAALDPLRDQGRAYAAALAMAGVDVRYQEMAGTIHGFISFRRAIPSAVQDLATCLAALKTLLAEGDTRR